MNLHVSEWLSSGEIAARIKRDMASLALMQLSEAIGQ